VSCLKTLNNKRFASGSYDNTIKIWKYGGGEKMTNCQFTLNGHAATVSDLEFKCDTNQLISSSWDKSIRIWSLNENEADTSIGICVRLLNGHMGYVYCLKLFDEDYLASGSEDKCFRVWQLSTGKCVQTVETEADVWKIDLIN
jgi:WD40 repeat protein